MAEKSQTLPDPGGDPGPGEERRNSADSTLDLVQRAGAGDQAAANALCRRYMPRLQRWATGRLPRSARDLLDTGDLVQQAMTRAILRIRDFEPRHEGAFQVYLRRTLLNLIQDASRRVRVRPASCELNGDGVDPAPSPFQIAVGNDLAERYNNALERLRDEDREAIVLRIEFGCSYQEVADALGKPSVDAARMTVTRALYRIAQELGDEG